MVVLSLIFIAFSNFALAADVVGTVDSVDDAGKTLEIATDEGSSSISYDSTTKWPEGVTDPNLLAFKKVKVLTDDSDKAISVEESDSLPEETPDSMTQDED